MDDTDAELRAWAKAEVDKAPDLTKAQVEAIREVVSGRVISPEAGRHRAATASDSRDPEGR